jgi:hypothetical protein
MENEKVGFLENIRLWWKFDGRYYHKDFIKGVKNLIRWFPVIWKDRDWDYRYIWDLNIQKLKFQSKYISKNDNHTRAKRDAQIMMTCVRLMEKIKDNDYEVEHQEYYNSNVTFIPKILESGEKVYTYDSKVISENFDEYFKKYPRQYKKVLSGEVNRFKRDGDKDKNLIAMEISIENHNRAKKLLFKLMDFYIEYWWD